MNDYWKSHIEHEVSRQCSNRPGRLVLKGQLFRDLASYENPEAKSRDGAIDYRKLSGMISVRWKAEITIPVNGNRSLHYIDIEPSAVVFRPDLVQAGHLDSFLQNLNRLYENDEAYFGEPQREKGELVADGSIYPKPVFASDNIGKHFVVIDEAAGTVTVNVKKILDEKGDLTACAQEAFQYAKNLPRHLNDPHRRVRSLTLRVAPRRLSFTVEDPGLDVKSTPVVLLRQTAGALLDLVF